MDKIEVSQRAREAAADHHWPLCNAFGPTPLGCSCGIEDTFARFERDILATRTGVAPVAWMYEGPAMLEDETIIQDQKCFPVRQAYMPSGWTETPLYTHPPATDVAALVEAAKAVLPSKLCGESWGLSDAESLQIVTSFGKLKALRQALALFTKGQNDEH